ncbi:hypothetical protein P4159_05730 [Bacillus thuringiensis]|nr:MULTISPECIES: hypothetical protein [Bacillus cereus group]MEC3417089.1 hypothetical protein [Bacillus cereus]MEC3596908.1 hypothetical protein [Bacillus thuringiensis]MED1574258.1 hypothetical protein [Bacillus paranthracis]MED1836181.1 hypothetical protein [Bacillus thuringiensis]MED2694223.1 hypothetical protein [Bacillus thuringiensis]
MLNYKSKFYQTNQGGELITVVESYKVKKDGTLYKKPFARSGATSTGRRMKFCNKCELWRSRVLDFRMNKANKDGKNATCRHCERKYFHRYDRTAEGQERFTRRRVREERMYTAPAKYRDRIVKHFGDKCPITGSTDWTFDHVVPLAWDVKIVEYGNILPMNTKLNKIKKDKNLFDFVENDLTQAERNRFNLVVLPFLAAENHMSIDRYKDYINDMHQAAKK